jgi:hypothetical protein
MCRPAMGLAFQIPHRDEASPVLLANLVDCTNVRMVQSGGRSSLTPKAFKRLRVLRKVVWKEFQGNETAKFRVLSLVDHSHAATT